jgi:hypothetical protein
VLLIELGSHLFFLQEALHHSLLSRGVVRVCAGTLRSAVKQQTRAHTRAYEHFLFTERARCQSGFLLSGRGLGMDVGEGIGMSVHW